jgi:hypothetical protein
VVTPFPIERERRSVRSRLVEVDVVKIDFAHDQMEVAGEKIRLPRDTVGPNSPDGPSAAGMSVEGGRTELEARE